MALEKKYNHHEVEKSRYDEWKEKGYFKSGDASKKPFTIVIPPPNVTGKLHLGHAWDNTLQDIIIRRKRMQGYDALYLPGMDHAGIATQARIDQRLKMRGTNRFELGRESFLKEAWHWKDEYAAHIREQWEALGISVDYDKERFTLDDGLSNAVNMVFIKLYERGLIYRKERIINWDIEAKTALSNIEVEHFEIDGALYYFKYVLEDKTDNILIATTRPETMFADTAVMIHPNDSKRKHFIGKKVYIPGTDVLIPVIEDDYVDQAFGTGAVKVTPAHDPNDFEVGQRHNLSMPSCMEEDGKMNHMAHQYEGMMRFDCRKQVVKDLQEKGLLTKIEPLRHSVGHSERTGVIVEPRLSMQWFVDMGPLAKKALEQSTAQFIPSRFEKTFRSWMENIQDWCISRQLWWGHRIPAYYKGDDVYVGNNPPKGYVQDEDVLDTWFSSALWPFSTLGWPEETGNFHRYFPTQVMVTGYDIIFFWVARMIFQSLEFTKKTPFEHVLIHGLIRDDQGRKMSKSLGNGVDPMDIKKQYGMDTLRYFLTTNSAPGQDLRFEMEKVESSWNYINKLWNIGRFILMHVNDLSLAASHFDKAALTLKDRWILHRLNETIDTVNRHYDHYEFGEVAKALYNFSWDDFASWYIECSKVTLFSTDQIAIQTTKSVMRHVFIAILKMLHPFIPFVTEALYKQIPNTDASIMISDWPQHDSSLNDPSSVKNFKMLQSLITEIRHTRNDYQVIPTQAIDIYIQTNHDYQDVFKKEEEWLHKFIRPNRYVLDEKITLSEESLSFIHADYTLYLPLGSLMDIEQEISKQESELNRLESEIKRAQNMLSNSNFLAKAPQEKVLNEKEKLENYEKEHAQVKQRLEELKKSV